LANSGVTNISLFGDDDALWFEHAFMWFVYQVRRYFVFIKRLNDGHFLLDAPFVPHRDTFRVDGEGSSVKPHNELGFDV
jgi:hypothetical protein